MFNRFVVSAVLTMGCLSYASLPIFQISESQTARVYKTAAGDKYFLSKNKMASYQEAANFCAGIPGRAKLAAPPQIINLLKLSAMTYKTEIVSHVLFHFEKYPQGFCSNIVGAWFEAPGGDPVDIFLTCDISSPKIYGNRLDNINSMLAPLNEKLELPATCFLPREVLPPGVISTDE